MAFVTPPVCVAAYAGALLAKADYVKTGIAASFLSFAGYIVPFVFVYEPDLLLMGSLQNAVLVAIRVATAISFLAGAFVEWPGFKPVELARRACFFLGGVLIALPYSYLTILGVALGLLGLQAAVRRGFVRGKDAFKRI